MIDSNIPKRPTLLAAAGLAIALVLGFALSPIHAFAASKGQCKKNPDLDGCPPVPPAGTTYTAEMNGAFAFGPVDVTLERNELKGSVAISLTRSGESAAADMWNTVLRMPNEELERDCHLFGDPNNTGTVKVDTMVSPAGRKGWSISRGADYTEVAFTRILLKSQTHTEEESDSDPTTPTHAGLGDLDLALILSGTCADEGTKCDDFPPVPGVNDGISEATVTEFWFHAKGDGGVTHQGEGCHLGKGELIPPSTLTITASSP